MANRAGLLDAGILILLAAIAARILGSEQPEAMAAGYVITAATIAAIPVGICALRMGFRKG